MKNLFLDSGIEEFRLTPNGEPLRFNPGDPNVYARFMELTPKIKTVETEMAEKAKKIDPNADGSGESVLMVMRETDKRMKEILNEIFGHGNDFDKILEGVNLMAVASNKKRIISNLLESLYPIMEEGARNCVDSEVDAAKLNREQRRAMGR